MNREDNMQERPPSYQEWLRTEIKFLRRKLSGTDVNSSLRRSLASLLVAHHEDPSWDFVSHGE